MMNACRISHHVSSLLVYCHVVGHHPNKRAFKNVLHPEVPISVKYTSVMLWSAKLYSSAPKHVTESTASLWPVQPRTATKNASQPAVGRWCATKMPPTALKQYTMRRMPKSWNVMQNPAIRITHWVVKRFPVNLLASLQLRVVLKKPRAGSSTWNAYLGSGLALKGLKLFPAPTCNAMETAANKPARLTAHVTWAVLRVWKNAHSLKSGVGHLWWQWPVMRIFVHRCVIVVSATWPAHQMWKTVLKYANEELVLQCAMQKSVSGILEFPPLLGQLPTLVHIRLLVQSPVVTL